MHGGRLDAHGGKKTFPKTCDFCYYKGDFKLKWRELNCKHKQHAFIHTPLSCSGYTAFLSSWAHPNENLIAPINRRTACFPGISCVILLMLTVLIWCYSSIFVPFFDRNHIIPSFPVVHSQPSRQVCFILFIASVHIFISSFVPAMSIQFMSIPQLLEAHVRQLPSHFPPIFMSKKVQTINGTRATGAGTITIR